MVVRGAMGGRQTFVLGLVLVVLVSSPTALRPVAPDVGIGSAPFSISAAPVPIASSFEATERGALTTIRAYSGEPNIAVAPDGTVYVTGLGYDPAQGAGGTMVFRRLPGETTFTYLGMPNLRFGGNDEAIAIAPDGTVWISGMYGFGSAVGACASMTASRDRGDSWGPTVEGICVLEQGIDRQWIAVDGDGRPWIALHEICCSGEHTAYRSDDGGLTFELAGVTSASSGFPGNLFVDRARGRIYEATTCTAITHVGPCLLIASTDAATPVWVPSLVARAPNMPIGLRHLTGAVDDAGNVYVTWIDQLPGASRAGPYVARSTDGGLTWSAPMRVGEAGRLGTMPWIAAGADGNVAVVWYQTNASSQLNADWNVKASILRGWTGSATPSAEVLQLSSTPVKHGPICTSGASCTRDRELLDFFEAAIGPDGTLHVVWPETGTWTLRVADVDAALR